MGRMIYLVVGLICLLAGFIGIFLPLLPTTPFVLLAAYCFSRSSERLHQKLLSHRLFGPIIDEWERHGVIPLKVKCFSSTMMLVMVSYPLIFREFDLWLKMLAGVVVIVALVYVWSRPSYPATAPAVVKSD
ncbi:MAG: YbaN family protein [Oceanospirillaceae bacterium]|nr:YbaN family protein [Oceanospirillaceae bacterium]